MSNYESLANGAKMYHTSEGMAKKVFEKIQGKYDIQVIEALKKYPVKAQSVFMNGLMSLAFAVEGGSSTLLGSSGSRIAWDMEKKVAKYGDKAFPLSEAQIREVIIQWLATAQAYEVEASNAS